MVKADISTGAALLGARASSKAAFRRRPGTAAVPVLVGALLGWANALVAAPAYTIVPYQPSENVKFEVTGIASLPDGRGLGTRIIPAKKVHAKIAKEKEGFSPSIENIRGLIHDADAEGWALPLFVTDLFLGCKEGARFDGIQDERVQTLFYRRSGPIAAAISIMRSLQPSFWA